MRSGWFDGETRRLSRFWSRHATRFDARYRPRTLLGRWLHAPLELRHEAVLRRVRAHREPSVLDVGCGGGRQLVAALAAGAGRAVGIDLAPAMIELARKRAAASGVADRVALYAGDALALPLGERFDLVWALGVFDYLRDPAPLLRRMVDLCRGEILATFRRVWAVRSPLRWIGYRLRGCPIYLYRRSGIAEAAARAGCTDVVVHRPHPTFYLLQARP